jgi:Na+/melibiose symporter-like transporter
MVKSFGIYMMNITSLFYISFVFFMQRILDEEETTLYVCVCVCVCVYVCVCLAVPQLYQHNGNFW